jgi:hypothetical protein
MGEYLDPMDIYQFDSARRKTRLGYAQDNAQNNLQRSQLRSQSQIQRKDLNYKFGQIRQQLPGGFAKRNLLNSGIYGDALRQYAKQREMATNAQMTGYMNQFGQLGLQRAQTNDTYANSMADIIEAENAKRATLASQLKEAY